jgi:hypothetical protein
LSRNVILYLSGALAVVGLILVTWLRDDENPHGGRPGADGAETQMPVEQAEPVDGGAQPEPGRYLLMLKDHEGLLGTLDEGLVFHGESLYEVGGMYSGVAFLERRDVKKIIWPEGVNPNKYPIEDNKE